MSWHRAIFLSSNGFAKSKSLKKCEIGQSTRHSQFTHNRSANSCLSANEILTELLCHFICNDFKNTCEVLDRKCDISLFIVVAQNKTNCDMAKMERLMRSRETWKYMSEFHSLFFEGIFLLYLHEVQTEGIMIYECRDCAVPGFPRT